MRRPALRPPVASPGTYGNFSVAKNAVMFDFIAARAAFRCATGYEKQGQAPSEGETLDSGRSSPTWAMAQVRPDAGRAIERVCLSPVSDDLRAEA